MSFPYDIVTRHEWGARHPRPMSNQGWPLEAFVHHTDSGDAGRIETRRQQIMAMRAIQAFHMDVREWSDIGYHFVIFEPNPRHRTATIFEGRDLGKVPAAQAGHNSRTLTMAVYGDGSRSALQRNTRFAIECLVREFGPKVVCIGGHRDVTQTSCPGDGFYASLPRIADALDLPTYAEKHGR